MSHSLRVTLLLLLLQCYLLKGFVTRPVASLRSQTQVFARPALRKQAPASTLVSPTVKEAANELLSLLIERRRKNGGQEDNKTKRIDLLVDVLVDSKVTFDPDECLNPPLYVVCYKRGPPPLWAKFGIVREDIQGQRYVYHKDGEKSVINYAEIFGKALHVRAYGTYERDGTLPPDDLEPSQREKKTRNGLLSVFGEKAEESDSVIGSMLTCPTDCVVTVSKGSLHFMNAVFDIPIAGTGYLRILYADPRLRIFVSPQDTSDDRWEKEGLIVVQVRSDLVKANIEL